RARHARALRRQQPAGAAHHPRGLAPPPGACATAALRLPERRRGGAAQGARRARDRGDGAGRPHGPAGALGGFHVSLKILLGLLAWGTLVGLDLVSVPQRMIARPLVARPIAGAVLADVRA